MIEWSDGNHPLHGQDPAGGGRRLLGGSPGIAGLLFPWRNFGRSDRLGARSDGVSVEQPSTRREAVAGREAVPQGICPSDRGKDSLAAFDGKNTNVV